ncbi:MAG: hypothetical protein RL757_55 [Bacteroidota bacterium]|jgi:hypothetical protein
MKDFFGSTENLDEKSVDFLLKAIERNNMVGFDFVEFKMAVNRLRSMQMDDATAIKSAFVTAATIGLTKEKLLETAHFYRNILVKERAVFDAASQRQQDQRIGAKLELIAKTKQEIAEKEAIIKQLQAELEAAQTSVREADYEINQAVEKINEAKSKFSQAHQTILERFDTDLALISANL